MEAADANEADAFEQRMGKTLPVYTGELFENLIALTKAVNELPTSDNFDVTSAIYTCLQ